MEAGNRPTGRRDADPHLSSLSGDAVERVTVMEWARYLGTAFGADGAVEALRFYEEINWISEEVYRTMIDYVRGLSLDELVADDDAGVSLDGAVSSLEGSPFERHVKSLEYIGAIQGQSLEHSLASLRLAESDSRIPTEDGPRDLDGFLQAGDESVPPGEGPPGDAAESSPGAASSEAPRERPDDGAEEVAGGDRCIAITPAGGRCPNPTGGEGMFCARHGGDAD